MRKAGFILVIDSYLVRKGVVSILNQIGGVTILQELNSTDSLIAVLPKHAIDHIIISQSLFDASGDIFVQNPALLEKTILLKDGQAETKVRAAKEPRAFTSIHLGEEKEKIVRTLRGLLDQDDLKNPGQLSTALSPRETTILRLISLGLTNRQIADELFLSAHTVMTHRKNISSKLAIKSVSGLTVYAIVNNIITIDEVTSKPKE